MQFQAGAFDMASAEKVIRLLLECAEQHLPVVCFISSGGMQTKEGAGALFSMAAVNDRITRFVRDHDLPVIVFGYGDCTGGAQASFVTHPLVQTYYWSGTSMPFAGQIVVPSNLPLRSILSNYLSANEGAMQGLVKHPFYSTMDESLRGVDASIPVADESVEEVMADIGSAAVASKWVHVNAGIPCSDGSKANPLRKPDNLREHVATFFIVKKDEETASGQPCKVGPPEGVQTRVWVFLSGFGAYLQAYWWER